MNHNNSVTINDSITNLMTLDDFNNEIAHLREFIAEAELNKEDKDRLKKITNLMTIKNTRMKGVVNNTMNNLNKCGMY